MNATLHTLRKVFPFARTHTLECLQATSFALAYVSSIYISHDVPLSAPSLPISNYCTVTPTKKEKVAQNVHSDPPRLGTSWLRPQTPECLDVEISAERLASLTVSLNELFRKLLSEIDGSRQGDRDDALARAVRELIRLGELEGKRDDVGAGAGVGIGIGAERKGEVRRGSWGGCLERRCDWPSPQEWIAR